MRSPILASTLLFAACATPHSAEPGDALWTPLDAGTTASLRGLSVVDARVVWASGSDGTVLRSTDGGRSWIVRHAAEARGADLRSIHAFDAVHAVAATAGRPARVLRTEDGGATWTVAFEERDGRAFFDAVRFADAERGFVFGDPVDAVAHYLLATADGGRTWQRVPGLPAPVAGEAGFAASGTCVAASGPRIVVATGGTRARALRSDDGGRTWDAIGVPLRQGAASQGVFSIAFADGVHGVAVGGDYLDPDATEGTAAFTLDGGRSWFAAERPPSGYRSGAACAPGFGPGVRFAVGSNGADVSTDGGRRWRRVEGGAARAHHAIAFAGDGPVGFAVGAGGRVTRVEAR